MEAKSQSILVTGAAGLAGSQVIREFVRNGRPVKALVRNRARARPLEGLPTVELVEADMADATALDRALAGVDRLLLIGSSDEKMVETQCAVIDGARRAGVKHVVKFSGLSAADAGTPFVFGRMHAQVERYLEQSGLAWTHLRPSQFMTEYLREVPTILGQNSLFLPLQDARLNPVDVADIAKAAFVLLTTEGHAGKVYAMSGPQALHMDEIAEAISAATGRALRYVPISLEDRAGVLLRAGMPAFLVAALDVQARERLKGGTESVVRPETHTALGITPTSFAQFARRNAGAFAGDLTYVGMQ